MKKIIIALLFTLPLLTFGQKIKIKKGIVTFDGAPVAKINTSLKNNYKFSNLKGEKAFDVVYKGLSASNTEGFQWLELTAADGRKTEVPYEVLMTSFSVTKLVVKLLSAKYNLITTKGIKQENVDAFFNEKRENLSDKYLKAVVTAKADKAERQKLIGKYAPFVKENGTVVFGGNGSTNIVGKVYYSGNQFTVADLDGVKVATAKGCSTCTTVKVTTYRGETFEYDHGSKSMMTGSFSRVHANVLVDELVGRGYHLGREAKVYNDKLHKEKVKIAKENSINLYGVPGYVIDKYGEKYEGIIYAVFEKLQINPEQQMPGIYDLDVVDNYGKYVSIRYTNEKGRKRIKKFSAKNKVQFCVTIDGNEECFIGMKTKGNALKKFSNASNFGFDNSYFYKKIYESKGNLILVEHGKDDSYVLKFKDKKEGFMIDKRANEKIAVKLAKYVSSCPSLSADLKKLEFDLKNIESLKQIVNEYCK